MVQKQKHLRQKEILLSTENIWASGQNGNPACP
jgi:hypothetical protein